MLRLQVNGSSKQPSKKNLPAEQIFRPSPIHLPSSSSYKQWKRKSERASFFSSPKWIETNNPQNAHKSVNRLGLLLWFLFQSISFKQWSSLSPNLNIVFIEFEYCHGTIIGWRIDYEKKSSAENRKKARESDPRWVSIKKWRIKKTTQIDFLIKFSSLWFEIWFQYHRANKSQDYENIKWMNWAFIRFGLFCCCYSSTIFYWRFLVVCFEWISKSIELTEKL